jgi:hypothetical protein
VASRGAKCFCGNFFAVGGIHFALGACGTPTVPRTTMPRMDQALEWPCLENHPWKWPIYVEWALIEAEFLMWLIGRKVSSTVHK